MQDIIMKYEGKRKIGGKNKSGTLEAGTRKGRSNPIYNKYSLPKS